MVGSQALLNSFLLTFLMAYVNEKIFYKKKKNLIDDLKKEIGYLSYPFLLFVFVFTKQGSLVAMAVLELAL